MFTQSPQSEQPFLESIVYDRRFIADILVGTPSPIHRRRQQLWIPTALLYFILFDIDSGQGDHSGKHLLLVGCNVINLFLV